MPIKDLELSSWLNGPNASYVESFYESWLKDPASVSEQWRNYFGQMLMEDAGDISREVLHSEIVTSLANRPHGAVVCDVAVRIWKLPASRFSYSNSLLPIACSVRVAHSSIRSSATKLP